MAIDSRDDVNDGSIQAPRVREMRCRLQSVMLIFAYNIRSAEEDLTIWTDAETELYLDDHPFALIVRVTYRVIIQPGSACA